MVDAFKGILSGIYVFFKKKMVKVNSRQMAAIPDCVQPETPFPIFWGKFVLFFFFF